MAHRSRIAVLLASAMAAASGAARADQVDLPSPVLAATGPVIAIWRPDAPGAGSLQMDWLDSLGRLVEQHRLTVDASTTEVPVQFDLSRALVGQNRIVARFQPAAAISGAVPGPAPSPERRAETPFSVRPPAGWPSYQVLIWQDQSAAALAGLRSLGVTGTAVLHPLTPAGQAAIQQRQADNLRWYTENLATDLYASYHRYTPGQAVNWRFDAARAQHRAAPDDVSVFNRTPSLSDPAWLDTITARLRQVAWQEAPFRPLFHNLADEAGIADLAAAWDFDLSAPSLAGMRDWLQARYANLAALNQAWGTRFATWGDVRPALTDEAVRSDTRVAAWMDFKAWMDTAFARAVRLGTDAVHRGDPAALAALEGAQVPGWGGYDYGKLADTVDVMEIYDAGEALEIAHSLNPKLHVLTTIGLGGAAERRQVWHAWLLGGEGLVLWDEAHGFMGEDGRPGPAGLAFASLFRELGGALGSQWLDAKPEPGRTAILYSQASYRMQWLLDRRAAGTPWTDRDAEAEFTDDNAWRVANRRAERALAGLGAQPRWITPETLAAADFGADGTKVLVLPHSIALPDAAIEAIRRFASGGGLVLADAPPGERDGLGRPRPAPPLADLAAGGKLRFPRALSGDSGDLAELAGLLAGAGAAPPLQLLDADNLPARGLDVRLVRDGGVLLVGIQQQPGSDSARDVMLKLPMPLWLQSLRGDPVHVQADHLALHVGAVEPVLLALSADAVPAVTIDVPTPVQAGSPIQFHLSLPPSTGMATHLVRMTVLDPQGVPAPLLNETVVVPPGGTTWTLRLAVTDPLGTWQVQAADVLAGSTAAAKADNR